MARGVKPGPNVGEPESAGDHPAPPDWLNDHAREEWEKVAPELHRRGKLSPDVEGTLANYCLSQAAVRAAEIEIAKAGHFIKGQPHPALAVQRASVANSKALAVALELTPHKRKDAAASNDEWEGLLA